MFVEMREKMFTHLSHSKDGEFNLKTDRGGITDIEFIAQYLMLANAPQNPQLTKMVRQTYVFSMIWLRLKFISQTDCDTLKQCYVDLRNAIHHLNLIGKSSVVDETEFVKERSFIQAFWDKLFSS